MAVYHYVANKDEILDGLVDLVFGEMTLPSPEGDWREEISKRAHSARRVLRRHPLGDRPARLPHAPGPRHAPSPRGDAGDVPAGGFTVEMTAHAYALLDSYVYGFALQEAALPFEGPDSAKEVAEPTDGGHGRTFPHMVEIATEVAMQPGYDFATSSTSDSR